MKKSMMSAKRMEELYVLYDLDEKTWDMLYAMRCHNLIDYDTWCEFYDKCHGYTFADKDKTTVVDENGNVVYIREDEFLYPARKGA